MLPKFEGIVHFQNTISHDLEYFSRRNKSPNSVLAIKAGGDRHSESSVLCFEGDRFTKMQSVFILLLVSVFVACALAQGYLGYYGYGGYGYPYYSGYNYGVYGDPSARLYGYGYGYGWNNARLLAAPYAQWWKK